MRNTYLIIGSCLVIGLIGCGKLSAISATLGSQDDTPSGGNTSQPNTIELSASSPATDQTVTESSVAVQFTKTSSSSPRATNPYKINIYSQANCQGTALSSTFVSSPQTTLTNLIDGDIRSVGIVSYNESDVASTETCSKKITGQALVSITRAVTSSAYLAITTDFTNKIAYVGANYTNTFFDAIDFTNEKAPTLLKSIGSASTPSTTSTYSRGIKSYKNGQRLLVASDGGSKMELWDLTSNPRTTASWTRLGTLTGLNNARKIAKVDESNPSQTKVYVALRSGLAIVNIAEPAGTMSISVSNTSQSNLGNAAVMGNFIISGRYDNATAYLFDTATLTTSSTYAFPDNGNGALLWAAAQSPDGTKGYVGGFVGGFFKWNASTPSTAPVRTYRYSQATYERDAFFVTESGKDLIYTSDASRSVSVWDVTDINNPTLIKRYPGNTSLGEFYGITVDPTAHRAYVATASGDLLILNTQMLKAPAVMPTSY